LNRWGVLTQTLPTTCATNKRIDFSISQIYSANRNFGINRLIKHACLLERLKNKILSTERTDKQQWNAGRKDDDGTNATSHAMRMGLVLLNSGAGTERALCESFFAADDRHYRDTADE
jgi:hypothetical protein